MKEVTKEEFENFIESYPRKLCKKYMGFVTPSSDYYLDFSLSELSSELEKFEECVVAEHEYKNPYSKEATDHYYIINKN